MTITLSPRLLACSQFIRSGDRVADIGCDHGYLGIYLLANGIASSVIAADINEAPLQSAVRNAEKHSVRDKIAFYLSDGARNIPRDFNVMVCAGMGADTIISVLTAAPWLKSDAYRLILQCQSKTAMLRQYLDANGWQIREERVLRDGRFLYTVMNVIYAPEHTPLRDWEYHLSPALLSCSTPEVREYYQQLLFRLRRAITGQGENADPKTLALLKELTQIANDPSFFWLKEDNQ